MKESNNFNINGTMKDYIELLQYKDSKKFKFPKKFYAGLPYFGASIVLSVLLGFLIQSINYVPPEKKVYTWSGILMFMSVCAGIGWIIHGTGFLLVRR